MTIIDVQIPGLRDLLGRFARWDTNLAKQRRQQLMTFVPKGVIALQKFAPRRTEVFANSIRGMVSGRKNLSEVRFFSNDPKAEYVINPTRPHLIPREIVRRHAIKLPAVMGRSQLRLQVMHPGTRGSDFAFRAFVSLMPEFQVAMNRAGVRAMSALAGRGA